MFLFLALGRSRLDSTDLSVVGDCDPAHSSPLFGLSTLPVSLGIDGMQV